MVVNMKRLLIEDDIEISEMLQSFLINEPFEVVSAYDGKYLGIALRSIFQQSLRMGEQYWILFGWKRIFGFFICIWCIIFKRFMRTIF